MTERRSKPTERLPARFIDACRPEIFTGDPLSFAELARLPLACRPKALVSTAMALLPGLRDRLEAHFGCPVLDTYALNEAGLVGVAQRSGEFELLQPRLYVEILAEADQPCPPGVRGEITLTGGYNAFVPLLRYRTGDYARLEFVKGRPVLTDLEGRPPTTFHVAGGAILNNVDVSVALRDFALPAYRLHQAADGALTLRLPAACADRERVRAALLRLFGADQPLTIEDLEPGLPAGKVIQYTSDYETRGA
jgi:phenylacetate-CoA ligase